MCGDLRDLVSRLRCAIRIKAKYLCIRLICAHAPTEDKDDKTEDAFYDKLEVLYNRCSRSIIKILVGDFSVKAKMALQLGNTVCTRKQATMASDRYTSLQHKTWLSDLNTIPDLNTKNQIYHVDRWTASSILDVRTVRGANMDSDHFLVSDKVSTHLCACNN